MGPPLHEHVHVREPILVVLHHATLTRDATQRPNVLKNELERDVTPSVGNAQTAMASYELGGFVAE